MTLDEVKEAVGAAGMAYRGAFHPATDDLPEAERAGVGTLILLGFVGSGQWAVFTASPEYRDQRPDPLDRWSHRVISALARQFRAKPYFPFTAPLMPFVKWARKAEAVYPSEIGMLIHPDFGLWHSWRGALAFRETFDLPSRDVRPRPCDACVEKPCLSVCPAHALGGGGSFNAARCVAHIRRPEGADCMERACAARRACPIGRAFQYPPEQADFYMRAFRGGLN